MPHHWFIVGFLHPNVRIHPSYNTILPRRLPPRYSANRDLPYNRVIRRGQFVHSWVPGIDYRVPTQLALLYVVLAESETVASGITMRMVARPQRGMMEIIYHYAFTHPQPVAILHTSDRMTFPRTVRSYSP